MDAFGKVPNLLKERELILHRRDFYHLAVFEAPDDEVLYLDPRMSRYALPPDKSRHYFIDC